MIRAKRGELGRKARERVLREHTFKHRARQLIAVLKGEVAKVILPNDWEIKAGIEYASLFTCIW